MASGRAVDFAKHRRRQWKNVAEERMEYEYRDAEYEHEAPECVNNIETAAIVKLEY
jgi:hypothetical protein